MSVLVAQGTSVCQERIDTINDDGKKVPFASRHAARAIAKTMFYTASWCVLSLIVSWLSGLSQKSHGIWPQPEKPCDPYGNSVRLLILFTGRFIFVRNVVVTLFVRLIFIICWHLLLPPTEQFISETINIHICGLCVYYWLLLVIYFHAQCAACDILWLFCTCGSH